MNDVLIHIKSKYDNSFQPARCKHCSHFAYEYYSDERSGFFGYCYYKSCRVVCTSFACDNFDSKSYFICVDKCKQLSLF